MRMLTCGMLLLTACGGEKGGDTEPARSSPADPWALERSYAWDGMSIRHPAGARVSRRDTAGTTQVEMTGLPCPNEGCALLVEIAADTSTSLSSAVQSQIERGTLDAAEEGECTPQPRRVAAAEMEVEESCSGLISRTLYRLKDGRLAAISYVVDAAVPGDSAVWSHLEGIARSFTW